MHQSATTDSPTNAPPDPLIAILAELTSASERQTDAIGSLARLVAEAAEAAEETAKIAEAAVRVFADEQGNRRSAERLALHEMKNMHQSINLLVGVVQGALKRLGPLELEVDMQRELRIAASLRTRRDDEQ